MLCFVSLALVRSRAQRVILRLAEESHITQIKKGEKNDIQYEGSESEWNDITLSSTYYLGEPEEWNDTKNAFGAPDSVYDALENATVHYNYIPE